MAKHLLHRVGQNMIFWHRVPFAGLLILQFASAGLALVFDD